MNNKAYIFSSIEDCSEAIERNFQNTWYDSKVIHYICNFLENERFDVEMVGLRSLESPNFQFDPGSLLFLPHNFLV